MQSVVRFITVLLLSLSLGLHWGMLQSVAWASMLVKRLQTQSIGVALTTTFDGRHPCRMCVWVHHGKSAERSQQALTTKAPMLELCAGLERVPKLYDPGMAPPLFAAPLGLTSRADTPALPPPRFS